MMSAVTQHSFMFSTARRYGLLCGWSRAFGVRATRPMCVGRVTGRWPILREVICGHRVRPVGPGVREFLTQVMTLMPPVWGCAGGPLSPPGWHQMCDETRDSFPPTALGANDLCGGQEGPTHPSEVIHLCQTEVGTF